MSENKELTKKVFADNFVDKEYTFKMNVGIPKDQLVECCMNPRIGTEVVPCLLVKCESQVVLDLAIMTSEDTKKDVIQLKLPKHTYDLALQPANKEQVIQQYNIPERTVSTGVDLNGYIMKEEELKDMITEITENMIYTEIGLLFGAKILDNKEKLWMLKSNDSELDVKIEG